MAGRKKIAVGAAIAAATVAVAVAAFALLWLPASTESPDTGPVTRVSGPGVQHP